MNGLYNNGEMQLTYNDLAIVPRHSDIASRWDVDITPIDETGMQIPVVVANMNAVAGKRMAEVTARRGAITVLPQDFSDEEMLKRISRIKAAHPIYETPVKLRPEQTVKEASELVYKRSHGAILVENPDKSEPLGLVTLHDLTSEPSITPLWKIMRKDIDTIPEGLSPEDMLQWFTDNRHKYAPVTSTDGTLKGVMTEKAAFRSIVYKPALDSAGRLMVAAAIGINGDPAARARKLLQAGVDILVLDTAHGDQKKMLHTISTVKDVIGDGATKVVAGNVVTAESAERLILAGADIVKVGVGPGAMCTTRVQTGVGRPQASAVADCVAVALENDKNVWADGGIKYPKDVAIALVIGASAVMIGSMFAPTYESPTDIFMENGRLYKSNHGMASGKAVLDRNAHISGLEQHKRAYFREGISSSKLFLNPEAPGAEDILDNICAGVRSAMTYAGALNLEEFREKAKLAVQTASGYAEGHPTPQGW